MEKEPQLIRIDERFDLPVNDDIAMSPDKIREAQQAALEGTVNLHHKIIIEVLEKYLGRKPTEEDFKKCSQLTIHNQIDNAYILMYEEDQLGAIIYELKIKHKHNKVIADTTYYFDPTARIE